MVYSARVNHYINIAIFKLNSLMNGITLKSCKIIYLSFKTNPVKITFDTKNIISTLKLRKSMLKLKSEKK